MTDDVKRRFASFLETVSLREISPISMSFKKNGNPVSDEESTIGWNQSLANEDPIKTDDGFLVFRFKFSAKIVQAGVPFFVHETEFALSFHLEDETEFDRLWSDLNVQNVFLTEQVTTTVWPIFRQHIIDSMTRLGLRPVTLPWLYKTID